MNVVYFDPDVPPTKEKLSDHSYSRNPSSPHKTTKSSKTTVLNSLLSEVEECETPFLPSSAATIEYPSGTTVNILTNKKVIGNAIVMEGDTIHCQPIPTDFTKISVLHIDENVKPVFKTNFDDEFLSKYSITIWPSNDLCLKL